MKFNVILCFYFILFVIWFSYVYADIDTVYTRDLQKGSAFLDLISLFLFLIFKFFSFFL